RLFFFHNYEEFRLPQTYNVARTVLTNEARSGLYTYRDSAGVVRTINLFQIAGTGAGGRTYTNTADPTVTNLLNLYAQGAAQGGTLRSRIASASDFNRLDYNFQTPGSNIRRFPTTRFDWNITRDHQLEFVYHYQQYNSNPDAVNGQVPVVPGAGIVLGAAENVTGSIIRNVFSGALALRSTLSNNLVNEARGTLGQGGISIFGQEATPALFAHTRGFAVDFPAIVSDPFTRSTQSRRHTPIWIVYDNLTWTHGEHSTTLGGAYTYIKSFQQSVGRQAVPLVSFGIAASDPVNTGATSIFTTANFPNSTTAQRTEAGSLYALLTGRVSSLTYQATLNPETKQYELAPFNEINEQREFGLFVQDQWRARPNLTLNYGVRWELDFAPRNVNGVYTTAGYESVFGVSGVGNVFSPGTFANQNVPQFRLVGEGDKPYKTSYKDFAPSVGFAWSPNLGRTGLLKGIFGGAGATVLRGGYSIAYVREGFNTFHNMWGANEGPTFSLGVNPADTPAEFGAPGSVLFRNATLPRRLPPSNVSFPITAGPGADFNEWDPELRMGYTQSWTLGIQRELTKNMALEIRYVGNHGTSLWRQLELNEVNIFENGFLNEFRIAEENLRLARAINPASNNFGPQAAVPGTRAIPIISTALGLQTDATFATTISRGEAGRLASNIAFNATRMNNLIRAGLVPSVPLPASVCTPTATNPCRISNFFIVNPLATGGSFLVTNGGHTNYNALQIELRRRFSRGLLMEANYTWGKSLSNMYNSSSAVFSQPLTMRNRESDKGLSPFDLRQALKVNGIWELPFGPGKRWLNTDQPVLRKLIGGWQIGGVGRVQTGTSLLLTSGRLTFNGNDSGVVLHNMTRDQLQDLIKSRKNPNGVVTWLPDSFIQNSQAAFEVGGRTLAQLDRSAPYLGPPTTSGELGARLFLTGPAFKRFDFNILKRTHITETAYVDFRAQFLNAFNHQNFFIGGLDSVNDPRLGGTGVGAQFGQTRSAYRDFTVSGTNDPGGRLVEFQLRLVF
ncbi:MAG: TonB-dependent receptor, partial [Acidobacteria bacterium]|nr:TonB-dependent receptor [Acidobacteriota bacterium]